jgi:hypothetical protein
MAKFVPICDIKGYVDSLRREGFYTELQIADIHKKHQDALDAIAQKKERDGFNRRIRIQTKLISHLAQSINGSFVPSVNNVWECNVSIKVGKDGPRVKVTFPFAELDHWVKYKETQKPPLMLVLKCMKNAGATKDMCKEIAAGF